MWMSLGSGCELPVEEETRHFAAAAPEVPHALAAHNVVGASSFRKGNTTRSLSWRWLQTRPQWMQGPQHGLRYWVGVNNPILQRQSMLPIITTCARCRVCRKLHCYYVVQAVYKEISRDLITWLLGLGLPFQISFQVNTVTVSEWLLRTCLLLILLAMNVLSFLTINTFIK